MNENNKSLIPHQHRKVVLVSLCFILLFASLPLAHFLAKKLTAADYYGVAVNQMFPEFNGIDGSAKPYSSGQFRGQYHLVFFGNTRCGSICYPRTLLFYQVADLLTERAPELKPRLEYNLFTIDPGHDTPARMYAWFDRNLAGGRSVIVNDPVFFKALSDRLGINPVYTGQGQFNHSDFLYLVDDKSQVRLMYGGQELDVSRMVDDIIKVTRGTGRA